MGVLDLIKDIQSRGKGSQNSSSFTQETKDLADFATILLPSHVDIQVLRQVTSPITAALKNTRPMFIRLVPDQSTQVPTDTLVMLVNPMDLRINGAKVNVARFTRGGWHISKWGDELDRMDASGQTGAFFVPSVGLTHQFRLGAAQYQMLYALLIIYKANGRVFLDNFDKVSRTTSVATSRQGQLNLQRIKSVGEVQIQYGNTLFAGSFDTLGIEERADAPYRMFYDFSFTVRRTVFTGSAGQKDYTY